MSDRKNEPGIRSGKALSVAIATHEPTAMSLAAKADFMQELCRPQPIYCDCSPYCTVVIGETPPVITPDEALALLSKIADNVTK